MGPARLDGGTTHGRRSSSSIAASHLCYLPTVLSVAQTDKRFSGLPLAILCRSNPAVPTFILRLCEGTYTADLPSRSEFSRAKLTHSVKLRDSAHPSRSSSTSPHLSAKRPHQPGKLTAAKEKSRRFLFIKRAALATGNCAII